MTVSELINKLNECREAYGELNVRLQHSSKASLALGIDDLDIALSLQESEPYFVLTPGGEADPYAALAEITSDKYRNP